jgi:hypothetical protein
MASKTAPTPGESAPKREAFTYDRLIKTCLARFYPELAAWLVGERPLEVRELDPKVTALQDRTSDKLLWLKFKDQSDLALHVEFQVEGRVNVPARVARYLVLVATSRDFKQSGARLGSYVVYLDRRTYRADPGRFELPGGPGTTLLATYNVVKLWELDPRPLLELESPGLCPFVPLHHGDPVELLIESKKRIVEAPESMVSGSVKQDLLMILGGLAGRVIGDRNLIARLFEEVRALGDNLFFDLIREEGLHEGIA